MSNFIREINEIGRYALDINLIDFNSFEVRREWNNIDVLIYSKKNKIAVVIENKIWSQESEHQLVKYQKVVEREFADYTKIYLYLTPFGDYSSNPDIWFSYDYEKILDNIEKTIKIHKEDIDDDILLFINHYVESLRRNIVGDKKLQDLCLDIYNEHKEAFDLIMNNLPDQRTIYQNIIIEYLSGRSDIIMDDSSKTIIRFITKNLDYIIPKSNANWTKSGRIFLFEIENFDSFLKLKSVVGPSTNGERNILLMFMDKCQDKTLFKELNIDKQVNRIYSHINSELILDKNEFDLRDEMTIKEVIHERLDYLFEMYISKVSKYLHNFKLKD